MILSVLDRRTLSADSSRPGSVLQELVDPFYFDPAQVSGIFRCECPPITQIASGILNGGFLVTRSHASSGSLKTNVSPLLSIDLKLPSFSLLFLTGSAPVNTGADGVRL